MRMSALSSEDGREVSPGSRMCCAIDSNLILVEGSTRTGISD